LLDQLAPGGRIVVPLGGDDVQRLSVVTRGADGEPAIRPVMPVASLSSRRCDAGRGAPAQCGHPAVAARADGVEVLLAHFGGPYWARKDAGAWSIPKG
jgi:hypothetical protein